MTHPHGRTRRRAAAALLVAGCVVATVTGCAATRSGATSAAGTPRRHSTSGSITAEQGTTWTLRQSDGQTTTITLTSSTRYGRRDQPTGPAQFPVGTAVRVLGQMQGSTLDATRILPPLAAHPEQSSSASSSSPPATPGARAVIPAVPAEGVDPAAAATTAVSAAVASATSHPGVFAGVAVMDRNTGQLIAGTTGSAPFESASVVKLFTIVDLLHRSETGAITLSPQDDDDIGRALRLSDDDAMDDLWENDGGTSTVTDIVGLAHLQDTRPASDPDEWGETVISARDVTAVYRYAFTRLTPADQQIVTDGLTQASDTGADGFDQAFGLLQPPRPGGALAKQGWMTDDATFLHTTGVPTTGSRWIIAVLTQAPESTSWDTARSTVDDATRTLTAGLP